MTTFLFSKKPPELAQHKQHYLKTGICRKSDSISTIYPFPHPFASPRVLQAIDTQIHESVARLIYIELFTRGKEQGFSLQLYDQEIDITLRVAFAQQYNADAIIIYYAPTGNMGEFMRQLTAFKNNENSPVKAAYFNLHEINEAARFICDFFESI